MPAGGFTPDQIFEFKLLFMRELARQLDKAQQAYESLLADATDAGAVATLHAFFHHLAGTAPTAELPVLGHAAGICERVTAQLGKSPLLTGSLALSVIGDGLAAVRAVLDTEPGPSGPPSATATQAPAGTGATAQVEGREQARVLVIDDDPFSAKLIDDCLQGAGFDSTYVCDPRAALKRIKEDPPDLIVLDVVMPGIDGFELCRRVRMQPSLQSMPILFVTRRGDIDQRVRGLEVGGSDYIPKPFDPRELIARVRSHLTRLSNLQQMAVRDGLTRCYNHKYFRLRLEQEVARAQRYRHQLAVAMLDVDHFKQVNDSYGHPAGDSILVQLSNVMLLALRSTDVIARYGGEEFGIVMVEAGATEAHIVCNRLRQRIADHVFEYSAESDADPGLVVQGPLRIPVTASIGVAEFMPGRDTWKSLLERADRALYGAKQAGRNRVMTARASQSPEG